MPQETKAHGFERPRWEGRSFRPANHSELCEVIEAAFDYRGDVTFHLKDGTTIEAYVVNRDAQAPEPYVQIFPKKASGNTVIQYADIVAVEFTGEDPAFGKSWDGWVAKSEALRRAEAERVRAEAEARGDL